MYFQVYRKYIILFCFVWYLISIIHSLIYAFCYFPYLEYAEQLYSLTSTIIHQTYPAFSSDPALIWIDINWQYLSYNSCEDWSSSVWLIMTDSGPIKLSHTKIFLPRDDNNNNIINVCINSFNNNSCNCH